MIRIQDMQHARIPVALAIIERKLALLGYESSPVVDGTHRIWKRGPLSLCIDHTLGHDMRGFVMLPPDYVNEIGDVLAHHARIMEKGEHPERYPRSRPTTLGSRGI